MRHLVERLAARLGKHGSFALDPLLSGRDLFCLLTHNVGRALRGLWVRLGMRRAASLVMVGSGVRVRHARHFSAGKNLIIDDYAEVMALSRQGVVLGDHVTIGAFATIKPSNYYGRDLGEGLMVGDRSNIGAYCYVGCSGLITIGNDVMISPRVSLYAENHNCADVDRPMREQGITRQPIVIEDDCWIASGSIILAGVTVGRGSVVAAGSVVTRDVPPYSVVAGVPATVLRSRRGDPQREDPIHAAE
jgi:acetyltransferase-like isoleucine patch superfamily enzyme